MTNWKKERTLRQTFRGFTLIELIIVTSIIAIVLAALFTIIDPFQQVLKAEDANTKQAAISFISASTQYYSTQSSFPWDTDESCKNELQQGRTLDLLANCLNDLITSGELKQGFATTDNRLQNIAVNACGDGAMLCSKPVAKADKLDPV